MEKNEILNRTQNSKLCSNYFKLFIHQKLQQIKKYKLRSIVSEKPNKDKKKDAKLISENDRKKKLSWCE